MSVSSVCRPCVRRNIMLSWFKKSGCLFFLCFVGFAWWISTNTSLQTKIHGHDEVIRSTSTQKVESATGRTGASLAVATGKSGVSPAATTGKTVVSPADTLSHPTDIALSLREKCQRLNKTKPGRAWNNGNKRRFFENFLVVDAHKTIYCYIPKASSSTWKNVILNLSGLHQENFSNIYRPKRPEHWIHLAVNKKVPRLGHYSLDEIDYKIKHYFKFMVVRNPWDRLVSTYIDKFYRVEEEGTPKTYTYNVHVKKIKQYAAERHFKKYKASRKIAFEDFLAYVVKTGPFGDEHWDTYDYDCHPCLFNFDFIGKVETMEDDKYAILRGINVSQTELTRVHSFHHKPYSGYYKGVNDSYINALRDIYRADFDLFGYSTEIS